MDLLKTRPVHPIGNHNNLARRNAAGRQSIRDGLRNGDDFAGTTAGKSNAEARQPSAGNQIVCGEDKGERMPKMREGGDERRPQAVRVNNEAGAGEEAGQPPRRPNIPRGRKPGGNVQRLGARQSKVSRQTLEKFRRPGHHQGTSDGGGPPQQLNHVLTDAPGGRTDDVPYPLRLPHDGGRGASGPPSRQLGEAKPPAVVMPPARCHRRRGRDDAEDGLDHRRCLRPIRRDQRAG